jgi:drug/metabolite transporter (DMT)-like permease
VQGWNPVRITSSIVLLIGIIAVSTASILIRNAQTEVPSLVIASYRMAIASLAVVPVALWRHQNELHKLRATELLLATASGAFLALHFAAWVTSLEYTSVTSSVVLDATSPLWVAIGSWLLLRERLTRPVVLGLIVAVTGSLVIGLGDMMQGSQSATLLGNSLALVGALMVTGYWLIGRRVRGSLSLAPYAAIAYSMAAIVLLIMVGAARQSLTGYGAITYMWLVLLALVPQLIGHSSFNWALARLPAVSVAVATLGEPIGATVLAYVLLGETPTIVRMLGAALVLAGIAVTLSSQPSAVSIESQ